MTWLWTASVFAGGTTWLKSEGGLDDGSRVPPQQSYQCSGECNGERFGRSVAGTRPTMMTQDAASRFHSLNSMTRKNLGQRDEHESPTPPHRGSNAAPASTVSPRACATGVGIQPVPCLKTRTSALPGTTCSPYLRIELSHPRANHATRGLASAPSHACSRSGVPRSDHPIDAGQEYTARSLADVRRSPQKSALDNRAYASLSTRPRKVPETRAHGTRAPVRCGKCW